MKKEEVIDRVYDALGPRRITAIGVGMAGAGHATKRQEVNDEKVANNERALYGVIWVDEEQYELSKKNDFVWFVDIMPEHEGKLEERPPEIQKLPAQISIYTHDPRLLFDELMGSLFSMWSYDNKFKTAQKWYHPGTYVKPKKSN
jgi:hypothetical protein